MILMMMLLFSMMASIGLRNLITASSLVVKSAAHWLINADYDDNDDLTMTTMTIIIIMKMMMMINMIMLRPAGLAHHVKPLSPGKPGWWAP